MRKKKKAEEGGFSVWRSYSDMMAGVLLLFVLIMCVTLAQAQKSYDESIKERDEKIAMQEAFEMELLEKQRAMEEKDSQLETQTMHIEEQDEALTQQQMLLAEYNAKLKEQEARLNEQEAALNVLQNALNIKQEDLDEKTALLADQQQKIDNIIGVKAEVVESLKQEFSRNNLNVDIDAQTGALILDANVMFDYDEAYLTEEGEQALRQVLPIYCKVLLNDDYKQYLAEILIDGYTDTDGDYGYNLELSQQRSLAVAQYLLDIEDEFLSANEQLELRDYLTVNGHSMSNPILDAQGNVDKDASRRVEVKFRLKDDEMIQELNRIMSSEAMRSTPGTTGASGTQGTEGTGQSSGI